MSSITYKVFVYRSQRQRDAYVYLLDENNFDVLPESLCDLLGELSYTFSFDLASDRKLAQADTKVVMKNLSDQGFYVQLPPSARLNIGSLDERVPTGF